MRGNWKWKWKKRCEGKLGEQKWKKKEETKRKKENTRDFMGDETIDNKKKDKSRERMR